MANLLILGGTIFLGRHLVESAIARGHTVTLFNRGIHHPDLFPDVEKLHGDRTQDLSALRGRTWDAVIDTCGYHPREVRATAELLADQIERYVFISTISVYGEPNLTACKEDAPVAQVPEDVSIDSLTDWVPDIYGALKAECERTIESILPGRVLNIRPGLIVGPFDPTDRFTYWPCRIAQGGNVLAPGQPDRAVQFIDVRDLADWTMRMVEEQQTGVFNATGPERRLSMEDVLLACRSVVGSDAVFTWVEDSFLLDHKVKPFTELPLWVPQADNGIHMMDCGKAIAQGLRFRALPETIADTLAWDRTRPLEEPRKNRLAPSIESALLSEWMKHTPHTTMT